MQNIVSFHPWTDESPHKLALRLFICNLGRNLSKIAKHFSSELLPCKSPLSALQLTRCVGLSIQAGPYEQISQAALRDESHTAIGPVTFGVGPVAGEKNVQSNY